MSGVKEIKELVPVTVTLESSLKLFGLQRGESVGTAVSVEFSVPGGVTRKDLTLLLLAEQERLDKYCLLAEHAKGAMDDGAFNVAKASICDRYDLILKNRDVERS